MVEILKENPNRLEFETLYPGDELVITTGLADEAYRYDFAVNSTAGRWPSGTLKETNPAGAVVGPFDFELHGCGDWTTRQQNPVQDQRIAFTPYYEGLIVGRFMWGKPPGAGDRLVFDRPGQKITEITHIPFRENTLLQYLGAQAGAATVKQIVEFTEELTHPLTERDVRATLAGLVQSGIVLAQKKKALQFALVESSS